MEQDHWLAMVKGGVPDFHAIDRGISALYRLGKVGVGGKLSQCGSAWARAVTKATKLTTIPARGMEIPRRLGLARGYNMLLTRQVDRSL
jgi:hypothetical protein